MVIMGEFNTEIQRAKEDLEDLEAYINEYSSFLPVAIFNLSLPGIIIEINKTAEVLTEYMPIEIIGQPVEKIFYPEEEIKKIIKEVQGVGFIKNKEIILITKSQKKIPVNLNARGRRDIEGDLAGYFISATDISEFKKLQKELEEAGTVLEIKVKARTRELKELAGSLEQKVEERTREIEESRIALMNILGDIEEARRAIGEERDKTLAVITNFTDGLVVLDKENKVSLVNPRAEGFFNIKAQDIIGKSVSELSSFPKLKSLTDLLTRRPGQAVKAIFREELLLKKNLTLEVSTISVRRAKEKIENLIILHDVTREKIIERLKTEFVSLSAHQLRTPLSAIKWTLRMLLDGDLGEITEEQREYIEETYKSNEGMIGLINDLLDVTRIEEGRYIYKPVFTQIESLVQSVITSYKEQIKRKKIKLGFKKTEKKLPLVKVDVEKMSVAIQNLIDNAIRYTPREGEVRVSLKYAKKEVEFSVRDTGIGIPKEQQKRVFTKFFRGVNAMRLETRGSGLGLYITKNIIEAHGGKIWFESKEGQGTTFHFTLPVEKGLE